MTAGLNGVFLTVTLFMLINGFIARFTHSSMYGGDGSLHASHDLSQSSSQLFNRSNHKTRKDLCRAISNFNKTYSAKSAKSNYGTHFFIYTLLKSGDINPNPGPTRGAVSSQATNKVKRTPKNPCATCWKGVTRRSKAISCDSCNKWTHSRCTGFLTDKEYDRLVREEVTFSFYCDICSLQSLPFAKSDLDLSSSYSDATDVNDPAPLPSAADPDLFSRFRRRGLHFVHINARSILPKLSEIKLIASQTRAAIISVSESWLDSSITDSEILIDGYYSIRKDRNRQGGGVCMFIRSDIASNLRTDINTEGVEAIWTDILLPKSKPILVGTIYRPQTHTDFLDKFDQMLSNVCFSQETYILGDLNICSRKKPPMFHKYNNLITAAGFDQIIKEPTRVDANSKSTIDHILCNSLNKVCQSGVIPIGLSDHFITFCSRKTVKGIFACHNTVKMRVMKHYSVDIFTSLLENCDWSSVLQSNCVNSAWVNFKSKLTSVLDKVAPKRIIRIKQRTEPWMSSDILEKIRQRDKIRYLMNKGNSDVSFKDFALLRNQIQREVKRAKSQYFKSELDDSQGDPKKLWKHLNNLGYSTKDSSKAKIVLEVDGKLCSDSLSVCNHINNFFSHVADTLVSKLPSASNVFGTGSKTFVDFYRSKGVVPNECALKKVDEDFIFKELSTLNTNKGVGLDEISPRFLKDGALQLTPLIAHIVNLSIDSSTVPDDFKVAKVIPLFKKKSRLEVGNYRPVSLLSCVSKILEKSVYVQVENYLSSKKLLYQYQSGFRAGFSTDTCLIFLTDFIRTQLADGNYVGMLLLDVQKAFDSVNHKILCDKLEAMGIDSSWFKSYLSNRQQLVCIDGVTSDLQQLTCGVPQGSLLGPLLYLCYSNDMETSVHNILLLYADDSVIIAIDKDPDVISRSLGLDLKSCNSWLVDNKLSLHVGKTECILFGSKRQLNKVHNFNISYNDQIIHSKSSIKYLGVTLDQHLSGDIMANSVISRVTGRLKFLYRYSHLLNHQLRKNLCSALLQCHIDYCCSSWFIGLNMKFQHKLQIIQNKMIRFILNMSPREHVGQAHFDTVKLLDVQNRARQLRLNHMFNIFHSLSPSYFDQFFTKTSDSHSHHTRSSAFNFHVPRVKGYSYKSFFYRGALDWNALPSYIKGITVRSTFKLAVKKHLACSAVKQELAEFV